MQTLVVNKRLEAISIVSLTGLLKKANKCRSYPLKTSLETELSSSWQNAQESLMMKELDKSGVRSCV